MNGNKILNLGIQSGPIIGKFLKIFNESFTKDNESSFLSFIKNNLLINPEFYLNDSVWKEAAEFLVKQDKIKKEIIKLKDNSVPYTIYGLENIESEALMQMDMATKLPIAIKGALMPDAHTGYGLPIGGVLATQNTIIPYGVGNDIGCRMHLSIYNLTEKFLLEETERLKNILIRETLFGTGQEFLNFQDHKILDDENFNTIKILKYNKDKASKQLGTSGSGNHFVEFGIIEIFEDFFYKENIIHKGKYLGVLSHSGSRNLGSKIAEFYTKIAKNKCSTLPEEYKHLSWLNMDSEEGQEYWTAMNVAGNYAKANHEIIHNKISKALGEEPLSVIQNHHNFAWKEIYDNEEYIVHRKGATPAGINDFGIIPGNMTDPGYIVKGLGNINSLNSASHGAGRLMSRNKAREKFTMKEIKDYLKSKDIILIGGDTDEGPGAYKNIDEVMNNQKDLVKSLGKFQPKIVRMSDSEQ